MLAIGGFLLMLRTLWTFTPPDENSTLESVRNPDNVPAIAGAITGLFAFVCGVNIAKGRDWARWLYTVYCVILLILDVFYPLLPWYQLLFSNFVRVLFLFLIFLPSSSRYIATPERKRF
jgi:hypothetical protein